MLLTLAGEEAALVEKPRDRLSRLLNIADMQNSQGHHGSARGTLGKAIQTLRRDGDKLDLHTRLAGWVSVSQLSRSCRDRETAISACNEATKVLRGIEQPADRCPFVRGVTDQVRALHGNERAAALLREAGPWADQIDSIPDRRVVLRAFTDYLVDCKDYDGAKAMIRRDNDPAWRSDTLADLARQSMTYRSYGKQVNFEATFKRQAD